MRGQLQKRFRIRLSMRKVYLFRIQALLLMCICLGACSQGAIEKPTVVGSWWCSLLDMKLVLSAKGTGSEYNYDGADYARIQITRWTLKAGLLTFYYGGVTVEGPPSRRKQNLEEVYNHRHKPESFGLKWSGNRMILIEVDAPLQFQKARCGATKRKQEKPNFERAGQLTMSDRKVSSQVW